MKGEWGCWGRTGKAPWVCNIFHSERRIIDQYFDTRVSKRKGEKVFLLLTR